MIKRLFTNAIAVATLLSGTVVVGLVLSYLVLWAAGVADEFIVPIALGIVGGLAMAIGYFRFHFNPLTVGSLGETKWRIHAVLVAVGAVVLVLMNVLHESQLPLALTAPVVVVLEEIIFRGMPLSLLSRLQCSSGVRIGVVFVFALAFSVLHVSPFVSMFLDRLVFAVLAQTLAIRWQSLWPSVIFHLFSNAIALSAAPPQNEGDCWFFIGIDFVLFFLMYMMSALIRSMGPISEMDQGARR
ncbi:CPBP family intramembrane glutamic endopeptidase [Paenarthrobacter sp. NPDC090520]|uniref:CPBP family intramembrane glutamic endopeptidase n=1 Tax=unclassified Paenarthrobacter TaxID=2634190 RepID=UPI0038280798